MTLFLLGAAAGVVATIGLIWAVALYVTREPE